jgi:hypothetical protein
MIEALVALIIGQPGMAERILAAHVDDGKGRCSGCVQHGRPGAPHPCVIRSHALQALAVRSTDHRAARSRAGP